MSEPFVFDSRYSLFKTPFGAVTCGQAVTFRCRPLAAEGFTHCALVLRAEFSGASLETELVLAGPAEEDGRISFTGEVSAPEAPDLVWYHFRFWREDSSGCILDKTGYRSDGQVDPWQLTVYEKTYTPTWFGAGVTYQIFPDRFHRLSIPDPAGMVGNRWVHEDWSDAPVWKPDPDGEVRNRDFFGGSLAGITAKLDVLEELGVTTLYLNPIFEAASNHRYNTADYSRVDPMLGTEEDLRTLCVQAKQRGIRVMLDGVFNHTGSQSRYFNADGFYPTLGAAQSQESPYYNWFSFHPWPDDYDSWWGIRTLPAVREEHPDYVNYIIEDEDSIIRRWLRTGISGWRLDVADELPDWFIGKLRAAAVEADPEAFILGEVWEDASTKVAYDQRRKYLLGHELHGVMNYPFRTALLDYLRGGDAGTFAEAMEALRENYPPDAFYSAMNFLGTHDTPRILTVLGARKMPKDKAKRAAYRLSPKEREKGLALVELAALILFTFPGSPTVYYGDEVGMEGWEDPFNRGTYPWGHEDEALKVRFTLLGRQRNQRPALQKGTIRYRLAEGPLLAYEREYGRDICLIVVNADHKPHHLTLPWSQDRAEDLLSGQVFESPDGQLSLTLPPYGGLLLH
ncbi:glycoside hydrolase family 13 protein [Dysosmobacter sp.]|uniref:glycoside hydrolase family 13 protein n=1 Tax=Dysosmobacter sp. TaxID=2591382 RepID=UPI002A9DD714|nr:glycoside hydrolase family 13 protein [Dysosmobacter sp.]MDY5612522.1 glycoside hydrolase family 13 protein [Dysosmobacter sp.]